LPDFCGETIDAFPAKAGPTVKVTASPARRARRCPLHWSDEPHECPAPRSNAVPTSTDLRPCARSDHHSFAGVLTISLQTATTPPNTRCPGPSSLMTQNVALSSLRPRPTVVPRSLKPIWLIGNHPFGWTRHHVCRRMSVQLSRNLMIALGKLP